MLNFIKNFRNDEDGAVTVDWVVLTAAIVGLGLVVGTVVSDNVTNLVDQVGADIAESGDGLTAVTSADVAARSGS